jgi:acetyl-CoA carboxylase carboxyltransferase component
MLDNDAADKGARFVSRATRSRSARVPRRRAGHRGRRKAEAAKIIRHGAKMLRAVSPATVPKIAGRSAAERAPA